jgi:hypothetical protein
MIAFDLYADQTSYAVVETLKVHAISRTTAKYYLDFYKLPDLEHTVMPSQSVVIPKNTNPLGNTVHKDGCGWPVVWSYPIPSGARSGVYCIKMTNSITQVSVNTTVVLKANVNAPLATPILFVIPVTRYLAYNNWGAGFAQNALDGQTEGYQRGKSLYKYRYDITTTTKGSVERDQTVSFDPNTMTLANLVLEEQFLKWFSTMGIPVDFCTSIDLDKNPGLLNRYNLLISPGQDEYWSKGMRDNVEGFINSGKSVAFFSGNTCWWQVRFENNHRKMVCHKVGLAPELLVDPLKGTPTETGNWGNLSIFPRPETRMTGVSSAFGAIRHDRDFSIQKLLSYHVWQPTHWAFKGVTLIDAKLGLGTGIVGYEVDGAQLKLNPDQSVMLGQNGIPMLTYFKDTPINFKLLASADLRNPDWHYLPKTGSSAAYYGGFLTMGTFRGSSGNNGMVFTAATTDWSLGLNNPPPPGYGLIYDENISKVTKNILERLVSVHVYEYQNTDSEGIVWYRYSTLPDLGTGWTRGSSGSDVFNAHNLSSQIFNAGSLSVTPTISIYEYHPQACEGTQYKYSSRATIPGWSRGTIPAFFAYGQPGPGIKEVHEYYKTTNPSILKYSTHPPEPGYSDSGPVFGAYEREQ